MSVPSNISKENFRLLYSSSDEESEDLHLEITPNRKKKIARRDRARSVTRNEMSIYSTNTSYVLHWGARGITLVWLIVLTWFAVSFYDKVAEMHTDIAKVSTSSSSVNDELQGCHTTAKELRGNASLLSARVSALEEKHNALALKVEAAVAELAAVTKQLADAPSLANTPRRMAELQQTVANFGSQIQGFDIAVEQAHKQSLAATAALEEVKATLQRVEVRANQTAANITERAKLYRELKQRIDDVNGTLTTRIEALRASVKDNNMVSSPATSTAVPTSAAPSAGPAPVSQQSHSAPPTPLPVNAELDTTVATTRGPVKPIITQ